MKTPTIVVITDPLRPPIPSFKAPDEPAGQRRSRSKGYAYPWLVLFVLFVSGCAATAPNGLLEIANDPAMRNQVSVSDRSILQFSDHLRVWWGNRSMKAEVFGTGSLIAMDALTTAALAVSGGGFGSGATRGLIAGVDFIKALFQRIDPGTRDNAFNTGTGIVLAAQGEYMTCITQRRATVPSLTNVSACGSKFLVKINSAISVVGNLMAGLLPSKEDFDNVHKPVTAVAE